MVLVEEKTSDIIKKELLSYDYNELEALMEKQNYQDVKKVEYN